jgi:membrane protease YdiL (CAAX protease family)
MREFVRQRPLVSFYVLAILIALAANVLRAMDPTPLGPMFKMLQETHAHLNILTAIRSTFDYPAAYTFLLFPAAPMLAALVVTGVGYGRAGFRELLSRCAPWRAPVSWRQGVTVIAVCFVVFFALTGMMWVQTYLYAPPGTLDHTFLRYGSDPLTIYAMLAASLLISPGPLLEELGWRGFALPHLLKKFDPLSAALILGIMWWAWHLPRDLPTLFSGAPGAAWGVVVKQFVIAPGFIAGTIIAVFVCNKLGGSLWGGLLTHAIHNELGTNVTAEWSPAIAGLGWRPWDFIEVAVAIALVLICGRSLGATSPYHTRLAWGDVPPKRSGIAGSEPGAKE